MGEEVLRELIEFIKTASPVIWEAARRQVMVDIIHGIIMAIVSLVIALALARAAISCCRNYEKGEGYEAGFWFSAVFGIAALAASLALAIGIIGPLMNPNYYAIKILIQLFTPQ